MDPEGWNEGEVGGKLKREGMYVYADLCCCTAETKIKSNYPPIKSKLKNKKLISTLCGERSGKRWEVRSPMKWKQTLQILPETKNLQGHWRH